MSKKDYYIKLYKLQNSVLKVVDSCQTDFYLTGGTVLGRFLLMHRYSDDLDFFVNNSIEFKDHVELILHKLSSKYSVEHGVISDSYVRIYIEENKILLKVEFVNDVEYHYGSYEEISDFKKIDNWRNILSNKISAITRNAAKDVADILYLSMKYNFSWKDIIEEAKMKDLWVNEISVAKHIGGFNLDKFDVINWIQTPDKGLLKKKMCDIEIKILNAGENIVKEEV